MTTDNIAWFFTFALAAFLVFHITKSYIDGKVRDLYNHTLDGDKFLQEHIRAQMHSMNDKINELRHDGETSRNQIWREIDSMWDKQAENKAMSKNYYNSDAGTGCCKTAQEYLKG